MATEVVKTTAITNFDAFPPVRPTAGKGGVGMLLQVDGTCHVTSGVTAAGASYYKLARIPTNAIVKKVELWLDVAGTTITGDIGLYYSSSANDGTPVNKQGAVLEADMFGAAVALAAVVVPTEYTFKDQAAGTDFMGADSRKEIWNAAGTALTSDPGGFFDLVFTLTSTAGSAADVNARVTYCMPGT